MITPQQAQELLDRARPGPWEVKAEETSTCGDLIEGLAAWVESDSEFVFGRGMEIEDDEELKNLALAAAAPALAELVAGLRYEYAVQRWTDGVGWETVCVRDTYEKVEALTYLWRDDMYRVARRPVGEWEHAPEVVE